MRNTIVLIALAVTGCEAIGLGPKECESNLIPGIGVSLVDSITGGPVIAENIRVVFTDGSFADTVFIRGTADRPTGATLMHDRPGEYHVEITAPGYAPWATNVRVRMADECHVDPEDVVARLQPLSGSD